MSDLFNAPLSEVDPLVSGAIDDEVRRQAEGLELIASENFVSEAVLEAMGSVFTNKYAEGYVGKRYYGGCEFTDVVEQAAIDRAKQIFGAEHANVQPHSGSQANFAVYTAQGWLYKTAVEGVMLPITYRVIGYIKRHEPTYGVPAI